MTLRSFLALLGAALIGVTPGNAPAADGADKGQTYAVVVGVGESKDAQIKARPTAVADAQAIYDLFVDPKTLGIEPANIQLLLSVADEKRDARLATKENIVAALTEVAKKAKKEDTVLIAFIGNGASSGEKTTLFATDSTFKDRAKNGILSNEIASIFKDTKTEHLLAMLDVNFKGFDPGDENLAEPRLGDAILGFFGIEKEDDQNRPNGRAVIFANGGSAALDLEKHGIFTTALIEGLKGAADVEGEPDGFVIVDELQTFLDKRVPQLARENGKTREEKEIVPFAVGQSAHFPLTRNPAVYPKIAERLEKLAKLDRDQKVTKEVAEEGQKLLSRMPKLKALRDLRTKYEAFIDGSMPEAEFLAARAKIRDSMTLDGDEARTFARKVIMGIDTVASNYIKELDRGTMVADAINGMYKRIDAQVPTELADKIAKAKGLTRSELSELLLDARLQLGKREDLDAPKDVDIALATTLAKLDPYTNYMDKETLDRMASQLKGEFTGIGIQIRRDLVRDGLLVVTPIKGSPAYKAGIQAGDLITKIIRPVDNAGDPINPPEELSTKGMKVDEAVRKILGKADTPVTIVVEREGEEKPLTFDLRRKRVEVESVLGWNRKKDDSWEFMIDPTNKIGYIHLTQFARNSYPDMLAAVNELEKQGLKGLILDLRFNPGGYLDTAVNICDMFIDDGLIVKIRPRIGEGRSFTGQAHMPSKTNFPMVVLVNGFSASGSEIVGACLQDNERAIVMGERSYGKGSVQNIAPFGPTGGEIKMTTATFWRPISDPSSMKGNLNKSSHDLANKTPEDIEKLDWGVRPNAKYNIELTPQERGELEVHMREREIIQAKENKGPKKEAKEFKDKQLDTALMYLRGLIKPATAQGTK